MKNIVLLSMAIILMAFSQGCKKMNNDPVNPGHVPMGTLVVSPAFSWKTTQEITFVISADYATMISILSEDGSTVYHKGFFNGLNQNYQITVSLPAYIKDVMVNGQPVAITGTTIPVSLTPLKSSGLTNLYFAAPRIPELGLVSAWHFDENSGTLATDAKGSNNGTISGASWVPGISHSALDFDGVAGHVQVPYSNSLNNTTNQISLSCWFKMNEVGDNGAFIFNRVKYMLRLDPQGRVSFSIYNPVFTSLVMDYADRILNTDWHHVVATYDGAQMKLYIDGKLKNSMAATGNLQTSNSDLYIGDQSTLNFFPGLLDEVLLYSRPLTEAEVLSVFNTTPNPGTGNDLISAWPLNENAGTTVTDATGGNNGTITGATWVPGISGSCLHFNGTTDWVKVPKATNLNVPNSLTMMAWAKTEANLPKKRFE